MICVRTHNVNGGSPSAVKKGCIGMIEIKSIMLGELGANCYVITDRATGDTAVIDPGAYNARLDSIIKEIGYDKVKYVLLTHGHFDHIGGVNEVVSGSGGKARVAIGRADIPMLTDSMKNLAYPFSMTTLDPIKHDITLDDNDKIMLGESEITVINTPGHSKGSVCFLCGDSLFTGDTLFAGSAGRTDFPGGSYREMKNSLARLAALKGDYKVYPGHDRASTLQRERESNIYITGVDYDSIY